MVKMVRAGHRDSRAHAVPEDNPMEEGFLHQSVVSTFLIGSSFLFAHRCHTNSKRAWPRGFLAPMQVISAHPGRIGVVPEFEFGDNESVMIARWLHAFLPSYRDDDAKDNGCIQNSAVMQSAGRRSGILRLLIR